MTPDLKHLPPQPGTHRLAPRRVLIRRLFKLGVIALALMVFWLSVGMAIYGPCLAGTFQFSVVFENTALIAAGMGPLSDRMVDSAWCRVGIGAYSMGSLIFGFAVPSFLLAPLLHRLLHRFHLEDSARQ